MAANVINTPGTCREAVSKYFAHKVRLVGLTNFCQTKTTVFTHHFKKFSCFKAAFKIQNVANVSIGSHWLDSRAVVWFIQSSLTKS